MPFFISQKRFEQEVSRRAASACEQVITEMGAELHDDLVQKLSVFRLYIDRMERSSSDSSEVDSLLIKMRGEFEQIIRVVRSISHRLTTTRLQGDTIVDAIEMLCQNIEQTLTGHIHVENTGSPSALDSQKETHILRIVQELIQNAFKHSSAWHIWVRLYWTTEQLTIQVEDDGSGFSKIQEFVTRLKAKNNTLKMRAQAIDANLDFTNGEKGLLATLKVRL